MPELIRTLADLTGCRIRFATFPASFLAGFGRAADALQLRVRTRLPWDAEGIWVVNCAARCDDSDTRSELGVEPRPLRDTLARHGPMARRGRTSHAARAGRLATPAMPPVNLD
jgi:hypothetical protein